MLVHRESHPNGPRVFVGPWRIHHWEAGLALLAFGGWLIYDDRRDLPGWPKPPPRTLPLFDPEIGITTGNCSDGLW